MRWLYIWCVLCVAAGCQSDEDLVTGESPSLDDRAENYVVATVMGNEVTRRDLNWEPIDALRSAILLPLLEQYREDKGIVATEAEIDRSTRTLQDRANIISDAAVSAPF